MKGTINSCLLKIPLRKKLKLLTLSSLFALFNQEIVVRNNLMITMPGKRFTKTSDEEKI